MADHERVICASSALQDGGDGVRFSVNVGTAQTAAFAIRFQEQAHAYLNRCRHVPMELDWNPGKFFDSDATLLICSTHGALYDAANGACRGGPCQGHGLIRVPIIERDGLVLILEHDDYKEHDD